MTFDTGTWWLITIILTALLGCIGALVSRSIFKSLDEHSSDIKEVFLCQVGTKKFLRFYKPFIGG